MTHDGIIKEKVVYDAYGRPHSFSPGDISDGTNSRPDGLMNPTDSAAWSSGSVVWNKDIGNSSDLAQPDGVVDSNDHDTLVVLQGTFTGGWDLLGDSTVGNRKGFAGYEFDTVLQGNGDADHKPVYHVRHRVLASDTGKWFQKDPLGYHDSMDLYEYCRSNPIDQLDALGLASSDTICSSTSCKFDLCQRTGEDVSTRTNSALVAVGGKTNPLGTGNCIWIGRRVFDFTVKQCSYTPFSPDAKTLTISGCKGTCQMFVSCTTCDSTVVVDEFLCAGGKKETRTMTPLVNCVTQNDFAVGELSYKDGCCRCNMSWGGVGGSMAEPCFQYSALGVAIIIFFEVVPNAPTRVIRPETLPEAPPSDTRPPSGSRAA